MSDLARFAVFMAFASAVFLAVLAFITRKRQCKPSPVLFVVITGRGRGYAIRSLWPHPLPSTLVGLLRPTRIDDNLIAPNCFAHAPSGNMAVYSTGFSDGSGDSYVFSLVVGWHDYMPFPIYIPSLVEQLHRLSH
jgi:hypothetical protein